MYCRSNWCHLLWFKGELYLELFIYLEFVREYGLGFLLVLHMMFDVYLGLFLVQELGFVLELSSVKRAVDLGLC